MSKITFRADEELVERMEALDTSKSEAMRDALRRYLDGAERSDEGNGRPADSDPLDDALRARVDELVEQRVDALLADRFAAVGGSSPSAPQDVNVNISVDGGAAETPVNDEESRDASEPTRRKTRDDDPPAPAHTPGKPCEKCGEQLASDDVYCSNCGEKATHRAFCECGDEIRSDWAFCPGCGRRTSAADVLERS